MNDERALPFGIRTHELVIAAALAVGAAFAVELVPDSLRFSIAVGFLGLVALYLLIALRHIYRIVNETNRATRVLDYRSDKDTGILKKGDVRNVALRVETIVLLLDEILSGYTGDEQRTRLQRAGEMVGDAWGAEFVRLCQRDLNIANKTLDEKCDQWAVYDATAGMGRFVFKLNERGAGSVTLRNGFLSERPTNCELDYFFCGYLTGTLRRILNDHLHSDDREVNVELQDPSNLAHVEADFDVDVPHRAHT